MECVAWDNSAYINYKQRLWINKEWDIEHGRGTGATMDPQETLNAIKALIFDEKTLQDAKRLELLERLSDRVHLYYMDNKHYKQLSANEQSQSGEVEQAFSRAVRSEQDMFAVMHELDALKESAE